MDPFLSALRRYAEALEKEKKSARSRSPTEYEKKRSHHLAASLESAKRQLLTFPGKASLLSNPESLPAVRKMESLLQDLASASPEEAEHLVSALLSLHDSLPLPPDAGQRFSVKGLPKEIAGEMAADIDELQRCFQAECYRASVILCGRILETALHRKYYESTKNDLLEKSPGIGLGTLVAKLRDQNILVDPAVTQQIHLINQVRIYSVHAKKEPFTPTREQTHAVILYTLDIIRKLLR